MEIVVERNTVVGFSLSEQLFRDRQCFHSVSINVRTLKIIEVRKQKTVVIIIAFSLT